MIFNQGKIYGKIWDVKQSDKYIDLRMTTSEKNADGAYIYSTWFPRTIGNAFINLKDKVKVGDSILITKSKFSNESYKNKEGVSKSAFKFLIVDAEIAAEHGGSENKDTHAESKKSANSESASVKDSGEDDCPW